MLEHKVPPGAEREGGDGWVPAQEPLVVAVVRDAVGARGVVVDQAEVEDAARRGLGRPPQCVQASWDGPWLVPRVSTGRDGLGCLGVDYVAGFIEAACVIEPKYSGISVVFPS